MTQKRWKAKIKKTCQAAGTYKDYFEPVIDTLSRILEQRDNAEYRYFEDGGEPVIIHVNKGGASNQVKNPYLVLISDLNRDALAYWRELGLTPSSWKKVMDENLNAKKQSGFEKLLGKIEI